MKELAARLVDEAFEAEKKWGPRSRLREGFYYDLGYPKARSEVLRCLDLNADEKNLVQRVLGSSFTQQPPIGKMFYHVVELAEKTGGSRTAEIFGKINSVSEQLIDAYRKEQKRRPADERPRETEDMFLNPLTSFWQIGNMVKSALDEPKEAAFAVPLIREHLARDEAGRVLAFFEKHHGGKFGW